MTEDTILRLQKARSEIARLKGEITEMTPTYERWQKEMQECVAEERERCAKVAEDVQRFVRIRPVSAASCQDIAAAIRKGTND